ncbi:hypothetical protein GCM10009112_19230 [Marinomonas arenicola]|uniref:HEPN domain-containing protein n=1 Tax=Marinomonas TaxID=28253 RepID=UPI001054C0F8|nr:HEPN domain-containing protein [Marinomonas sp. KMM3893]
MAVQINKKLYKLFDDLIEQYAHEHKSFQEDSREHIKKSDFKIGGIIEPYSREKAIEIKERITRGIPTAPQLYKNKNTVKITNQISEILKKSNQIFIEKSEINTLVDYIAFDLINEKIHPNLISENKDKNSSLEKIITNKIKEQKSSLSNYTFKFPLHTIRLTEEIKLSKNIKIDNISEKYSKKDYLDRYKNSRDFEPNRYITIFSDINTSFKYAEKRALKASNFSLDALLVLYGFFFGNNNFLNPIIRSETKKPHTFNFFLYEKNGNKMEESVSYKFNYNNDSYDKFWKNLNTFSTENKETYDLLFSIADKIIKNDSFEKSIGELFTRSFKWFSDAIDEKDKELQIVKLTISIETLVNFDDESKTTDNFKNRVYLINHSNKNKKSNHTKEYAATLYNARSRIAHGDSYNKNFNFDIVNFTATTLLLALQIFSHFGKKGLNETGFKRKLPDFIDNLKPPN